MIALILSMINARRAQALTVFLLSAVSIAAAVAGPAAVREVDDAIVRYEVGAASNTERALSVTAFVNPSDQESVGQFETVAKLLDRPGFDQIRAGELEAFGPVPVDQPAAESSTSRVAFRDRVCEHLRMVAGRCLSGPLEVIVGEDTAKAASLRPGDLTKVQAARFVFGRGLVPDGPEATLTVAGIYRPIDQAEAFWAGQQYFPVTADGTRREAVFVTVQTYDFIGHSLGQTSVDALLPPEALTLDRLSGLTAEMDAITRPLQEGQQFAVDTQLPVLAERVARSRQVARQLVPIAFVPLVALCFFVIYLAVGYGVFGRRQELGMVALRGVTTGRRWWLATGETALVIVAGALPGFLLGHLAVGLVSWLRLDGNLFDLDAAGLPYAGLALAGALLVALLGLRRTVAEPVSQLLRGVQRASMAWRSLVVEVLLVTLAIVATVQLRLSTQELSGVVLLVPGLVVVAVALVAARAFIPMAGVVARGALRRGRLGTGLAAVQLARRPGSQRLFVLLAVATAMLTFVAASIDVSARAREDRALIATGAPTVVTVDQGDVRKLLHATHAVDPDGAWAMAVMPVEQKAVDAPPMLAVDSSRLANVATWRPEFGTTIQAVVDALRPPPAQPFVFQGTQLVVDVATQRPEGDPLLDLALTFAPLDGAIPVTVKVSELANGRSVRTVGLVGCESGCRLTGLAVPLVRGDLLRMTIYRLGQADPPADVIPAAALVDRSRWRSSADAQVGPVGDGLVLAASPSVFTTADVAVAPIDAQLPIPVVATQNFREGVEISSLDGQFTDSRVQVTAGMLPRLGTNGVLADLEYLERTLLGPPRQVRSEVWLGPNAPADAAERLRRAGLAVSGVGGISQSRSALARQGPALAMQFHLASAIFGMVLAVGGLGLVAAVDRRRRADDLRALRRQGLSARVARRAGLWSYLSTVVAAAIAGLVAGVAAWLAAGDRMPIFTDAVSVLRPPRWPLLAPVLQPWAVATVVMIGGSVLVAWALRRAVVRNGSDPAGKIITARTPDPSRNGRG